MKPPVFSYAAPTTVGEALTLLAERQREDEEVRVLAGGQSLIPLMNFRLAAPSWLVDLNRIERLGFIRSEDGRLVVGAMTRQADVEESDEVRQTAPLLAEAVGLVAHAPIRHRGTIGGSLAHADPAAELPAVLLALDGELAVASQRGERTVPAAEFFLGPFSTALAPDEILTEIRLPARSSGSGVGHAFVEFSRVHANFALVGVAAVLEISGGRIERAALALSGVAGTPIRSTGAEQLLVGRAPDTDTIHAAAQAATSELDPPPDVHAGPDYRRRLARTQVQRALEVALSRVQDRR